MNCLLVFLCFLINRKIYGLCYLLFLFTYMDSTTIHEAHSITRIIVVYVSVKVNLLEFESNLIFFI